MGDFEDRVSIVQNFMVFWSIHSSFKPETDNEHNQIWNGPNKICPKDLGLIFTRSWDHTTASCQPHPRRVTKHVAAHRPSLPRGQSRCRPITAITRSELIAFSVSTAFTSFPCMQPHHLRCEPQGFLDRPRESRDVWHFTKKIITWSLRFAPQYIPSLLHASGV